MANKRTLLVEGNDDKHVIYSLCSIRGVREVDQVIPLGSVDDLLADFPVRLKASDDGDIIGVVLDADTDLLSRWKALRDRLIQAGYAAVPDSPIPEGTVVDPPAGTLLPRVGVWLMPDNQADGILENFVQFLVPNGSRLFDHVKSSVASIPESERRFKQLKEPKALIHTWLAWQKEPGKPLGQAITARYLDPDVLQVDVLVAWLNRLFFE